MSKEPLSGKARRRKGHNFERKVARDLREIFGPGVKRGIQSRGGGKGVADVICPVFHIECKAGAKPSPRLALYQATDDCGGDMPVAIVKDDGKRPFVVMEYDDWLDMVTVWWINGGRKCFPEWSNDEDAG